MRFRFNTLRIVTKCALFASVLLSTVAGTAYAQKPNWQNLDLATDSVFGVSTERAYRELLADKPATNVLVAVIDAGIDTSHEVTRSILWHNPKEVAGNGKDDDQNGYVDDVLGWSFMPESWPGKNPSAAVAPIASGPIASGPIASGPIATAAATDSVSAPTTRFYGSANMIGRYPMHGTHVAGIIGAPRDKGFTVKGVADAVTIMMIRAVPPMGDEIDEDVANSIRYAVDNGAKVVNMSFAKWPNTNKKLVDEAVKYAMSKDVLLVHAAGNDNTDLDKKESFPRPVYADGSGRPEAWIEVGASGMTDDAKLAAFFSNYGKTIVDVFAPGVDIVSSVPGPRVYAALSGTSMAAPVVTGVAALIRSRYPKLTAVQVKEIIMKSVVKINHNVDVAGQTVPFSELCISGGIVNAYNALKLAETYK